MVLKLVIIGNTENYDIANSLLSANNIEIVAGIVDTGFEAREINQRNFLCKNKITEIKFDEVKKYNPDVCLIINFSKLIPTEYFKNTLLLNIHGGILPKWRGSNSNSWAIINNENEVGYTLHEANGVLDGGDIFRVYKVTVGKNDKYGEIIPKLRQKLISDLAETLVNISDGTIKPLTQKQANYIYTPKLKTTDGIIENWNLSSEYIYNLYRVMGAPYGSGVYFKYKNKMFEIKEMNLVENVIDSYSVPGAIVFLDNKHMQVKTANNVIAISKIAYENNEVNINDIFKIGIRL